jgi:hypothetical protein
MIRPQRYPQAMLVVAIASANSTTEPTFWDANQLYNQVAFWFMIIGFLGTYYGIRLGIQQLHKTKKAVDAAKDAVEKAAKNIRGVSSLIEIRSLLDSTHAIVIHFQSKNLPAANHCLQELREKIYQAVGQGDILSLMPDQVYRETIAKIVGVHDLTTTSKALTLSEYENSARKMHEVADVFNQLFGTTDMQLRNQGVTNAYTPGF